MAPDYTRLVAVPMELFNAARMFIMQDLYVHGNADFRDLRANMPGITDGNLAGHLRLLEKANLIQVRKEIIERKVRTSYEITKKGRKDFEQLREELKVFFTEGEGLIG